MGANSSFLLAILSVIQSMHGGEAETFSNYTGGSTLEITEAMLVAMNKSMIIEVNMASSGILIIVDDAFALLPNTEKIILSGNYLYTSTISDNAFRGLPRLWYLDLSGNSAVVSVTANPWTDLLKPKLTHLLIKNTQMVDADFLGRILSEYSRLLYLNATSVTNPAVNSYVIAHSGSHPMQELILDNCKLETKDDSLSHLTSLSHLSLNSVVMQPSNDEFMTALIQQLPPSITRLDLDSNRINTLDLSQRNDFSQLFYLSLRENFFISLPKFSSVIYDNLVYLDLSEPTSGLSSYEFTGTFKNLQVLKLNSSHTVLNNDKLAGLLAKVESSLKELILNGNYAITEFPDLSRYSNLTRLELHDLAITDITQEDFKNLAQLEYLDIRFNELITIADMRSHLTSLRELRVFPQYDIHLTCDCSLTWMKRASFDIQSSESTPCAAPLSLSSIKWVDITYDMIMTESNCTGDMTTSQDDTTTGDRTTTQDYRTTGDRATTQDDTTSGNRTTTQDDRTTGDRTTTHDDTTAGDMTTTQNATTTGDMTTPQDDTTTGDVTTNQYATTTNDMTTTQEDTAKVMNDESTTQDDINTSSDDTTNVYQSTTHTEDENQANTNYIRNQCSDSENVCHFCARRIELDAYRIAVRISVFVTKTAIDCTRRCTTNRDCVFFNYRNQHNGGSEENCHVHAPTTGQLVPDPPLDVTGWNIYELFKC